MNERSDLAYGATYMSIYSAISYSYVNNCSWLPPPFVWSSSFALFKESQHRPTERIIFAARLRSVFYIKKHIHQRQPKQQSIRARKIGPHFLSVNTCHQFGCRDDTALQPIFTFKATELNSSYRTNIRLVCPLLEDSRQKPFPGHWGICQETLVAWGYGSRSRVVYKDLNVPPCFSLDGPLHDVALL
jgi:hypothetical protein